MRQPQCLSPWPYRQAVWELFCSNRDLSARDRRRCGGISGCCDRSRGSDRCRTIMKSSISLPYPDMAPRCLNFRLSNLPASEPKLQIEATRRLLMDILNLDRYERRAIGRRDRAVPQIVARNILMNN
jgi:hypothetical protein